MVKVNRACLNCKFFDRFYIKGVDRFYKQNIGACSKCEQICEQVKDKDGICEKWEYNVYLRESLKQARRDALLKNINTATKNLTEVCQILMEGPEEV